MKWHLPTNKRTWDNTKYSNKPANKNKPSQPRQSKKAPLWLKFLLLFLISGILQKMFGLAPGNTPEFFETNNLVAFAMINMISWLVTFIVLDKIQAHFNQ